MDRGEVRVQEQVPPDHPMFENTGVELSGPLEVDLTARSVGEGVLVRGTLRGTVHLACRRCLTPVEREVDDEVNFLYAPVAEDEEAELAGEVFPLPARASEIDLTDAVREQVLLDVPEFVECREDCRGICPGCGAYLNEGACGCAPQEAQGPWDALKKLKFD
ncbi:MAG TPA: DUF177 domain-containing protein [Longimicrobium sp.]|nr:DUF177 domain-containing protein [Longimicrobium sp.]